MRAAMDPQFAARQPLALAGDEGHAPVVAVLVARVKNEIVGEGHGPVVAVLVASVNGGGWFSFAI
jgi:hypothetical protein